MADVNVVGVVAIVVFYMLILGIGLWAAWRRKEGEEEAMLAGRSIGMVVGTFTLTGNFKTYLQHIIELWFPLVLVDTYYKSNLQTLIILVRVTFPLCSDSIMNDFTLQAITRATMVHVFQLKDQRARKRKTQFWKRFCFEE